MAEGLSAAEIALAVERLVSARPVSVFGERRAHGLALILGLRLILDDGDAVVSTSFRSVD